MEKIKAKIYGSIGYKKNSFYQVYYQIDGDWKPVKSSDSITNKYFKTEEGAKKYCEKKFNFQFNG